MAGILFSFYTQKLHFGAVAVLILGHVPVVELKCQEGKRAFLTDKNNDFSVIMEVFEMS